MEKEIKLGAEIKELTEKLDKAREELSQLEKEKLLNNLPPIGSIMVCGNKEGILTGVVRKYNTWNPVISKIKKDGTPSTFKHFVWRFDEWKLKEMKV